MQVMKNKILNVHENNSLNIISFESYNSSSGWNI